MSVSRKTVCLPPCFGVKMCCLNINVVTHVHTCVHGRIKSLYTFHSVTWNFLIWFIAKNLTAKVVPPTTNTITHPPTERSLRVELQWQQVHHKPVCNLLHGGYFLSLHFCQVHWVLHQLQFLVWKQRSPRCQISAPPVAKDPPTSGQHWSAFGCKLVWQRNT